MWKAQVSIVVAAALLAACGSSDGAEDVPASIGSEPVATPSSVSSTLGESTETTAAPIELPYSTAPIAFTTSEGWQYEFNPTFSGPFELEVWKTVEDSPPGKARLNYRLSVPSIETEATNATPGRNAPEEFFRVVAIHWPLYEGTLGSGGAAECEARADSDLAGGPWTNRRNGHQDFREDEIGTGAGIRCSKPQSGVYENSWETDEAVVDSMIADPGLSLGRQPIVFFAIGAKTEGFCEVALFPSGSVTVGKSLVEAGGCI